MTAHALDTDRLTLRLGHSPDPDDAFMWWPLANFTTPDGTAHTPRIDTGPYNFEHVLEDIQSLNDRAESDDPDQRLEITAISIHQYPYVAHRYVLTSCGASMGDRYGPMIVARRPMNLRELIRPVATPRPRDADALRLAIPGKRTSAWLALQLRLLELGVQPGADRALDARVVPFDQIIPRVLAGEFDAGLIIHEGQITYQSHGLHLVEDLGRWWSDTRGLPLPLGGNCIRRDLGEHLPAICRVLRDSIEHALAHRDDAVRFALNYARDLDPALADRFVGMYVNDRTLNYGQSGREAVRRFLREGIDAGLLPDCGEIDFVEPA